MSLQEYKPGQELSSVDFQAMIGGPLSAIVDAQAQAALSSVNFIKSVGFTPDTEDTEGNLVAGSPIYVTFKYPKVITPYQAGVKGGQISSIDITTAGKGYIADSSLTLKITGGGGSGAAGFAHTDSNGTVVSIDITNFGNGYTTSPAIVLNETPSGTGSKAFSGTAHLTEKIEAIDADVQQMELEVPILTMLPIPFIRVDEAEIDFHAKITSMSYANVASNLNISSGSTVRSTSSGSGGVSGGVNLGFVKFGGGAKSRYSNSATLKTNLSYRASSRAGNKIDKVFQLGVKVKVSQDEMPEGMEKLMGILEDSIISKPADA